MNSNDSKEKSLIQESILSINNDPQENENKAKPKNIELTNITDNEKEDSDFKMFNPEIKTNDFSEIKIKDRKKTIKKFFITLIPFVYNSISFLFYYLSLEGCFLAQSECIPLLQTMFLGRIFIYGILATLMTAIQVILIFYKKFKFYHFIYTVIFYIIMYYYDHGSKLDYHGLYNIILASIFFTFFLIIISIILIIINSFRKKRKIPIIIILSIFLYLTIRLSIFFHSLKNACDPWDKGLNSTYLDNSPEFECNVIYPKKCLLYKINKYFDFSSYIKHCTSNYNQQKDLKHFLRYLFVDQSLTSLSDLTHFGYPITVNNPIYSKDNPEEYYNLGKFVLSNIILMDLYNHKDHKYYNDSILKPEVEVIYDKKTKKRKIDINLIKNETLSKERKEIENDPNNKNISLYKNIMVIYIDCISRQHFLRVMKKTSSFIKKFMKYNNNLGFSAYEFMRYQTFCSWTNPNVVPMFYSTYNNSLYTHIIKYLKENGYITAQSQNMCSKESFEIDPQYIRDERLEIDEYDHENIAMFCDPNYAEIDNPTPVATGPYGILRRCLGGKDSFQYILEYGKQFWQKYKDNKKYLRLIFQDAHEFTGQVVKYLDKPLFNFMNELYKNKELDDTAILFVSDHGNSYFNYFYYYILTSDDSVIEKGFGTLFIMLPNSKDNKNKEYLNNIYLKQQAFITPFDIHDTLILISYGNNLNLDNILYSQYGKSLVTDFEYKNRTCKQWEEFFVVEENCFCKNGFD